MPIFDQGYQHWSGHLTGHAWRWLAITRRGVKTALEGRWIRIFLVIAWAPALLLAFLLCLWGLLERQSALIDSIRPLFQFLGKPILAGPREFRKEIWTVCYSYFLLTELRFSMVLILLVGPNLISQDLRYNALPLYFSRPLRRIDYFLGKLGIIVALLGFIVVVPAIVAYVLGLLFSLDVTILRDTFRILLASVAYGILIAVSAGLLILALSSLSRNSRYVALLWIGIWFVTSMVSTVLTTVESHQQMRQAGLGRGRGAFMQDDFQNQRLAAAKTDWRPLVSYTTNLTRIGDEMLGTRAAWERLSQLPPVGQRSQLLLQLFTTQFPWYWSAGVLIVIAAFSVCILNFSVKPLDRLK
jgi:ABC-2 type transport system permease protein